MTHRDNFAQGLRDGIPIALGYFAVAFSLGINASKAGLNPFQGFLASFLTKASAGEKAGYDAIMANAPYLEMALVIFIANARYFLMSCSLCQNLDPKTSFVHRILMGLTVTDEVFAISVTRPKYLNPFYSYGAILIASICWAFGTAFGIFLGNIMPPLVVSALSVALYGMFLAIIIPPCRKNKKIFLIVAVSFALSFACSKIHLLSRISGGTRVIILTVVISVAAAMLFPKKDEA